MRILIRWICAFFYVITTEDNWRQPKTLYDKRPIIWMISFLCAVGYISYRFINHADILIYVVFMESLWIMMAS